MSLWDWTLEAYGRPGVAEACLALQDAHGQNTSYLLWAVWAEGPDAAVLDEAARVAEAWDAKVLKPLREARHALKPAAPPIDDDAREALRDDVKAAELRAERVLMETLETLSRHHRGGHSTLEALRAAVAAWDGAAPDEALAVLAGALS